MGTIKVKNDFYINDEKIKIISGAVHYFRIVPEYWKDTLLDLIDMGCNTVETYVPWNIHEPKQGQYEFKGIKDIEKFLQLANELGLYVILRASPYICGEWEMGGLPAWLLKYSNMKLRTSDVEYLKCLEQYFSILLPKVSNYQITKNGSIILAQLENEYGSYGQDKDYLIAVYEMMKNNGIEVPIFTSDGTWDEALEAGSLLDYGVFPTGNFGSKPKENIKKLKEFMERHNIQAPLMCMEFWDGWFNRWGQEIIRRDPEEFVQCTKEMLEIGNVNFYMFHGGTNFGWMNGCSARKNLDLPQITSYDYDAILTESGTKTEKYHGIRKLITKKADRVPNRRIPVAYGEVACSRRTPLWQTLSNVSTCYQSNWPMTMEELDHYYGYVVYGHQFYSYEKELRMRIVDARDRAKIYLNSTEVVTQYQEEIGDEVILSPNQHHQNNLMILIENMGRVNYGAKLQAQTQRKGIQTGVILDIHFTKGWHHYCLDFSKLDKIQWKPNIKSNELILQPTFHEYILEINDNPKETFIDLEGFGKGDVFVNNNHCGRFYDIGPTLSLYVPAPFLKKGKNQIIIFETEGQYKETIKFIYAPKYKSIM